MGLAIEISDGDAVRGRVGTVGYMCKYAGVCTRLSTHVHVIRNSQTHALSPVSGVMVLRVSDEHEFSIPGFS